MMKYSIKNKPAGFLQLFEHDRPCVLTAGVVIKLPVAIDGPAGGFGDIRALSGEFRCLLQHFRENGRVLFIIGSGTIAFNDDIFICAAGKVIQHIEEKVHESAADRHQQDQDDPEVVVGQVLAVVQDVDDDNAPEDPDGCLREFGVGVKPHGEDPYPENLEYDEQQKRAETAGDKVK